MEKTEGYSPQFHHVFPRGFLQGSEVKPEEIESLSNIAIIGPGANIRISAQNPLAYFSKYKITAEIRSQQFITGHVEAMTPSNFSEWVTDRAEAMREASEIFVGRLTEEITSQNVA